MLKWTSESEYFLSFEKIFADTIYHIQSKSNHFTPSAAHARRGVIIIKMMSLVTEKTRAVQGVILIIACGITLQINDYNMDPSQPCFNIRGVSYTPPGWKRKYPKTF